MTGGRLKRVREHIGNETFCFTYGDGVSNVNIRDLVTFHKEQKTLATLTASQPPGRFGAICLGEEQQYCSPGFNLAVGCFMRSPHGSFPEYHTSADNLEFVKPEYVADSYTQCLAIIQILENNKTYLNQNPKCEPRLGKRGLYRAVGGQAEEAINELAILWVLNLADGEHSLLAMAQRSGIAFNVINKAAKALLKHDLLKEI